MILAILILLPLAGACTIKLLKLCHIDAAGICMRLFSFIELALAALQLYEYTINGSTAYFLPDVCGFGMSFKADGFRCVFALVAAFLWFTTALFSNRYFKNDTKISRYGFFNLLTLTGVMGMFMSDDLYTAFIFFEVMSMASYPWVAHEETGPALKAGATYLGISVLGGMVTLMGMFLLYRETGDLSFAALRAAQGSPALYTAAAFTLFGFMAKAGAFPLHVWLPRAYRQAPAPATALLSGMLSKAGLFGILVVSFGIFSGNRVYGCVLLAIALVTMTLGAVLGVFSNDMKRTLACSSMSQIGYILTGVAAAVLLGGEGALPAQGAVGHMLNHSVLKLALFMAAGTVYMNLGTLELNDIRGFGRNKPLLHIVYLLGVVGLAGVPGFNGYLSKTMIHEGLVEWARLDGNFVFILAEWVFLFAAGLTTAYMLKTYIAIFWQKNADAGLQAKYDGLRKSYLDLHARLALALSAVFVPAIGLLPDVFVKFVSEESLSFMDFDSFHAIQYFSLDNLKGGAITLVIGTLVYLFIVRKWMYSETNGYIDRWPRQLDIEYGLYRPVFTGLLKTALCAVCSVLNAFGETVARVFMMALNGLASACGQAGEVCARAFMTVLTFAARVCETATDTCAAVFRQFVFTDNRASVKSENRLKRAAGRAQQTLTDLKPAPRRDPREVSDLSYGSYWTNTVSFGLIICTCGIVFALLYALFRYLK